jgi:class 3 adenylate cyclase
LKKSVSRERIIIQNSSKAEGSRMISSDNKILEETLHGVDTEGSDEVGDSDSGSGSDSAGASSTDTGATSAKGAPSKEKEEAIIAREENAAVLTSRIIVLAVLVLSTSAVAFAVYYYINKTEQTDFESQFVGDSYKVFQALGSVLDLSLGTVDAFVVSMVSYASSSNSTWPFVTLPNHAVRVAKIRSLSKAFIIQQYQFVAEEDRADWEIYANENKGWVEDVLVTQINDDIFQGWKNVTEFDPTSPGIVYGTGLVEPNSGPYTPSWQGYPLVPTFLGYNWNGIQSASGPGIQKVIDDREVIFSEIVNLPDANDPDNVNTLKVINDWAAKYVSPDRDTSEPFVRFTYPVLDTAADSVSSTKDKSASSVVAIVSLTFFWRDFIENILPDGGVGLVVVFENTCNQSFTYQINGPEVEYLGPGDLHDTKYNDMAVSSIINDLGSFSTGSKVYTGLPLSTDFCTYSFTAYPSHAMESEFRTSDPIIFMVIAVLIFAFTSLVFLAYDKLVAIRQQKVMTSGKTSLNFFVFVRYRVPLKYLVLTLSLNCFSAVQSNAIVTSLFPSNVRERMYNQGATEPGSTSDSQRDKSRLKTFLNDGETDKAMGNPSQTGHMVQRPGRPIADLFNDTTVLFADIAGFTAWSSVREPSQVFTLLEEIYGAFDAIAGRRGVFKVETIGDSYVAVTGLPEPRKDHAVVMAKFARDCRTQFSVLSRQLEVTLGPETGDLEMRFGLHSGPVTAGVLRGQKSRFQLFGDTVNTAARMESTGTRSRIQVSQSTADLLIMARKGSWVRPREELVEAKGKGKMQTYWVEPRKTAKSLAPGIADADPLLAGLDDKTERLIGYNTEVLIKLIRQIVVCRSLTSELNNFSSLESGVTRTTKETMVLDEVIDIIELPDFDVSMVNKKENPKIADLNPLVFPQLREYVVSIAKAYNKNPFHNFEHASHVCMSVAKLLGRIVAPDQVFSDNANTSTQGDLVASLHDHTYGITSDPLTQFACIFAALIHDADHPGVPNTQLVKEDAPVSRAYRSKSVAEQNSVDVAWKIFMDPKYAELRAAICPTEQDKRRFRQLVVNSVIATDIMDKDLKNLRNERWEKAFSELADDQESERTRVNRKATIVIEHLIQASDVAHTMQHWHIYRKWNERLFEEMHCAYKAGRAEKDPAEFWYQGELGFLDFYILPLTKKLSECGVFGVSSDEHLNYALKNREEWERRGQEVVAGMIKRLNSNPTAKKGGDGEV